MTQISTLPAHQVVRHLQVTPLGVDLEQFAQISSEKGKFAIFQALCFGGVQSLLGRTTTYAKMQTLVERLKKEGRVHEATTLESSDRFLTAKEQAHKAAQRLAIIHSVAEQSFSIPLEFTPVMQRGSSTADLAKKAEFAGVDVTTVQAIEMRNAVKRYEDANHAAGLAEALFYGANVENEHVTFDSDGNEMVAQTLIQTHIHPEMIKKALVRTRDWLLSWNEPDYAELGLLKNDIESAELALVKFEDLQERSGEGSRQMDEAAASAEDLQAGTGK